YKKELGWLNAATAAEVRSVAEEWLTRGYYELTVLPFPALTSAEPTVDRSKIPAVGNVSDFSFPEIETRVLSNGAKLVFAKHGSLPLVNVGIEFATGRNADTDGKVGVAGAVFDLLNSGTKKYSASELATEMDEIAMRPGIRAGREASFINYTILTPHFAESLKIAAEMVQNPSFPVEELEKERNKWLVTIAGRETNPARNASDYFDRAVYDPAGPLGKIRTKEMVSSISRDDLIAFHAREIAPENMTVYLVGSLELDDAEAALEKAFGKWKAKSASRLRAVGKAQDATPRVILVNQPNAVQSTIVAGLTLPGFDAEAATTLDIMNRIFGGGFEARINMNLREDKGWSYGMRSRLQSNPSGDQTLAVSGSVQTDKTTESMAEIMKEYAEFVSSRPATASELERVFENRTRSLPGSFSTGFTFLSSMSRSARFGLPLDHAESAASRIRAVTLEQVNATAKELIDPGKLTWVIVGDLAKIEAGVRALDYGAVEVWDAYGDPIR
ncbi:MAG: insulinase family protein, partial [Sphingomonadales bacterium]|nr:insulinase family protein [Sphingomonadales bacterium]